MFHLIDTHLWMAAAVAGAARAASVVGRHSATAAVPTSVGCCPITATAAETRVLRDIRRSYASSSGEAAVGISVNTTCCGMLQQQHRLCRVAYNSGNGKSISTYLRTFKTVSPAAAVERPRPTEASFVGEDSNVAAGAAAAAATNADASATTSSVLDDQEKLLLRCTDKPNYKIYASPSVISRLQYIKQRRKGSVAPAAAGERTPPAETPAASDCLGLRVAVSGGGCSGYKYSFAVVSLEEAERDGDL